MIPMLHPQLAHCRRLFLRDYEIDMSIGWHAFEKQAEQRVLLNIDVFVPLALSTPSRDHLSEVVDYDFIRSTIAARIGQGHIHLQETLVDDVACALLAHDAVLAVRVSSEKPDVYPDCRSVGIEVFHVKEVQK
jgi:dihydroneopterin aldolase